MYPNPRSLAATAILLVLLLLSGCERGVFLPWKCSDPAVLEGEWDPRAPDIYFVRIADGLNLELVVADFEADLGIEVRHTFHLISSFSATMNPVQREVLRCDERVTRLVHEAVIDARP